MNIAKKDQARIFNISNTMTVYEYPVMDNAIHGAVIELNGRYPEKGRVINENVTELGYVIEGFGKLIVEDGEVAFTQGDQLLIKPGQKYYWEAKATLFMPCAPAWYPEQHKEVV